MSTYKFGGDKNAPNMNFGPPPPVAMPSVPGGLTIADSATIEGDFELSREAGGRHRPESHVNGETTFSQEKPAQSTAGRSQASPSVFAKALGRVKHLVCVALVGIAVLCSSALEHRLGRYDSDPPRQSFLAASG